MELLSKAYVRAVAAYAGCSCNEVNPDFGIDLSIRAILAENDQFTDEGAFLEVQLKSTTVHNVRVSGEQIIYDLTVRNYEHLRKPGRGAAHRILVLFIMPEDEPNWLIQAADGMSLHRCCYYLSLMGYAETRNQNTVAVTIPQANVFLVGYLQKLLIG